MRASLSSAATDVFSARVLCAFWRAVHMSRAVFDDREAKPRIAAGTRKEPLKGDNKARGDAGRHARVVRDATENAIPSSDKVSLFVYYISLFICR